MIAKRVLVAMSGGVDSSVTALLLKQAGFEVVGVTMRLFGAAQDRAADQAAAVAQTLGIEHLVVDLADQFQTSVVDYFCEAYRRGLTPNPCIVCNRLIKFGALLEYANSIGARYLATGHYARIENTPAGYRLFKAADGSKDQSYFLYRLNQDQLSRISFPLGGMTKIQVKQMADQAGLPVFTGESQDICFLGGGDYRSFLESHVDSCSGDIVDEEGKVLGRHRGLGHYTIGQRQGLGIASNKPLYVIAIDGIQNRIVIGEEQSLLCRTVHLNNISWISGAWPADATDLSARIRYRMPDASVSCLERECSADAVITFVEPVRAVTPGQSAVIYQCGEVLGGGIITG
jgi:tRNA-specific 2-thiouridylase